MARLVEIQLGEESPPVVRLRRGDVLSIGASGGRVQRGEDVVRLVGIFLPAAVAPNGDVIEPMGPPSLVLFGATAPGQATIHVVTGDPWSESTATTLEVEVSA